MKVWTAKSDRRSKKESRRLGRLDVRRLRLTSRTRTTRSLPIILSVPLKPVPTSLATTGCATAVASIPARVVHGARHPRNNQDWPAVGIFAQRGKNRPNRIGSTIVRVLRCEGRSIVVAELDAIDGTPVLDVKPVMQEFLPREKIRQPAWSHELMGNYWKVEG